jgi:DNA polymerase III sliding clamp (beta) subunit (PCNA family)
VTYEPMELTVRRAVLTQLTEWALIAVPSNTSLPVNACVRVTADASGLTLAASDAASSVFCTTQAVQTALPGAAFIPAKKLRALLAEAPEGDVTVAVKGKSATVTAGGASWSLHLPAPDQHFGFPDLEAAEFTAVRRQPLLSALKTVRHAMGREAGRPNFTQIRIEESGGAMCAVAVDSSQVARCPVPDFPFPVSVPGAVLDDLLKLLAKAPEDEIEVAGTEERTVFRVGMVTLAALKSTHAFPDVEAQFLSQAGNNDQVLAVDKAELESALRRVRVSADTSTSAVVLIPDGTRLTVAARDKDGNSAEQSLVLARPWPGERVLLVVNADTLGAILSVHPVPECEFRVGRTRGKVRPPLLLEDAKSGVLGLCPQLTSKMSEF